MIKRVCLYDRTVVCLLYWVVLHDLFLSLLYKYTGSATVTNILFYMKDILMVVLFLIAVFSKRINRTLLICTILYLFVIVVSFTKAVVFRNMSLLSTMQIARSAVLLPVFCCIGNAIRDREWFADSLVKQYLPLLIFSALFGIADCIFDEFIGTKDFWRSRIGLTNFYVDIKKQEEYLYFGLPGNFYGSYGNGFFSTKRLVGFWGNPLTSAYSLLLPLVYYYVHSFKDLQMKPSKKGIIWIILWMVVVLSVYLSRTRAILLVGAMMIALHTLLYRKDNKAIFYTFVVACLLVLVFVDYDALWLFLYDGSTAGHILSIFEALDNISITLFGEGFGAIGMFGSVGSENMYLTLLGNVGLLGLGLYLSVFIRQILLCWFNKSDGIDLTLTVFYAAVALIITGMISEQLGAYTTIAPFYIVLGFAGSGSLKLCLRNATMKRSDEMSRNQKS